MCRSIKQLRSTQPPSDAEIEAAALQFVRKISGFRKPSRANQAGFDSAVADIAATTRRLLEQMGVYDGTGPTMHVVGKDTDYAVGAGGAQG